MSDTGRWEFARILAVAGNDLTLRQALQHTFTSGVTQVVRVPEFTTVNIPAGSSLRPAHAWDGIKGGIIAFLATGLVTVNGDISVDGARFSTSSRRRDSPMRFQLAHVRLTSFKH